MGLFSKLFGKDEEDAEQVDDGALASESAAQSAGDDADPSGASEAETMRFERDAAPLSRGASQVRTPEPTRPTRGEAKRERAKADQQDVAQPPPPAAATNATTNATTTTARRSPVSPSPVVPPIGGLSARQPAPPAGVKNPAPPPPAAASPNARAAERSLQTPRSAQTPPTASGGRRSPFPAPGSAGGPARTGDARPKAARLNAARNGAARAPAAPVIQPPDLARPPVAVGVQGSAADGRAGDEGAVNDDDDRAIDDAIEALQSIPSANERASVAQSNGRGSEAQTEADTRAVAETFAAVAAAHSRPLSEFMTQLGLGATPSRWAVPLQAVVAPVLDAARRMELTELAAAFAAFDAALARVVSDAAPHIGDAARAELEAAYRTLVTQLPDTFRDCQAGDGGKQVLLEALLLQVPSLRRSTLARFYAAGLQTLDQLISARPDEVAHVTGVDAEIARAISERLTRFDRERAVDDPEALRGKLKAQVQSTVATLEQLEGELERAREAEAAARKRSARRGLQTSTLELDALLAQLGEVGLIDELKRLPVRRKIERLHAYLERPAQ